MADTSQSDVTPFPVPTPFPAAAGTPGPAAHWASMALLAVGARRNPVKKRRRSRSSERGAGTPRQGGSPFAFELHQAPDGDSVA